MVTIEGAALICGSKGSWMASLGMCRCSFWGIMRHCGHDVPTLWGIEMAQKDNASSPWKMDDVEIGSFAGARAAMAAVVEKSRQAAAKEKPITKAEAARLGKAMIASIEKCDQPLAISLLVRGAVPNARDGCGRSALDLALEACAKGEDMHDFCWEVLERGGRIAPPRYTTEASEFNDCMAKGAPLKAKLQSECDRASHRSIMKCSGKWSLIKRGAGLLASATSDEELFVELGRNGRFGILRQAAASGAVLPSRCVEVAAKTLEWTSTRNSKPSMFDAPEGQHFVSLLGEPKAREAFDGPANEVFFSAAAWECDVPALIAMLDAGLRPGKKWIGGVDIPVDSSAWASDVIRHHVPLLIVAAASPKGRGAFDALKAFAPAVEEAKSNPPSAQVLSMIPVQRLAELHEAGVGVGSTDSTGNFAHWWARMDSEPRAGWATMAARAPEIFEQRDAQGMRPAERMAQKLRAGEDRDSFLASLSRIESREIRKEIGAPKKMAAASKPRVRL